MNTADPTLAARFFFRNCAVSLHLPGEMRISRSLTPAPDDIILDREFSPAGFPSEFIGPQSDFSLFLDITSTTNESLIKKRTAIGYILCNKLPRNGRRCRAFLCVNEQIGACENGKSLFAHALAQLCNTVSLPGRDCGHKFWLSSVTEKTNLVIVDDVPKNRSAQRFFDLCTLDWIIDRKCQEPLILNREKAPYLLLTADTSVAKVRIDGAFRRRFGVLDFSSFFGPENPIDKYFGRLMFQDWDVAQWHMFDNFMFYCVLEYLHLYSSDKDVFGFYA